MLAGVNVGVDGIALWDRVRHSKIITDFIVERSPSYVQKDKVMEFRALANAAGIQVGRYISGSSLKKIVDLTREPIQAVPFGYVDNSMCDSPWTEATRRAEIDLDSVRDMWIHLVLQEIYRDDDYVFDGVMMDNVLAHPHVGGTNLWPNIMGFLGTIKKSLNRRGKWLIANAALHPGLLGLSERVMVGAVTDGMLFEMALHPNIRQNNDFVRRSIDSYTYWLRQKKVCVVIPTQNDELQLATFVKLVANKDDRFYVSYKWYQGKPTWVDQYAALGDPIGELADDGNLVYSRKFQNGILSLDIRNWTVV
jgi:hypothetical protein